MSPEGDPTIRAALQHSIQTLSRWTVVLFLAVVFVAGLGFYDSQQRRAELADAVETINTSLCTFVADLQRRHDDTVQFLDDHPNGISGISSADLLRSINAQQDTLDSLAGLDCP